MAALLRRFLLLVLHGLVWPTALLAVSPAGLDYGLTPPAPVAPAQESRGLMAPPENVITREIGGHAFAAGDIYVLRHADTTALKAFGFRDFEFLGRAVGTIRYHAVWPLAVDGDALPAGLCGLNYEADPPRNEAFRDYMASGGDRAGGSGSYYYRSGSQRRGRRGATGYSSYDYGYAGPT